LAVPNGAASTAARSAGALAGRNLALLFWVTTVLGHTGQRRKQHEASQCPTTHTSHRTVPRKPIAPKDSLEIPRREDDEEPAGLRPESMLAIGCSLIVRRRTGGLQGTVDRNHLDERELRGGQHRSSGRSLDRDGSGPQERQDPRE
jgi:hypothetical protein